MLSVHIWIVVVAQQIVFGKILGDLPEQLWGCLRFSKTMIALRSSTILPQSSRTFLVSILWKFYNHLPLFCSEVQCEFFWSKVFLFYRKDCQDLESRKLGILFYYFLKLFCMGVLLTCMSMHHLQVMP